jgi:hypothetical protein
MIYLEARRTSPDEGALIWFRCEGGRQGTCHDGSVEHQNIIDANVAIADYVPPAPTWAGIRGERDNLLAATDWWAVSDRNMSAAEAAYRQSLRDVPQTFSSPADVVWPTKP